MVIACLVSKCKPAKLIMTKKAGKYREMAPFLVYKKTVNKT